MNDFNWLFLLSISILLLVIVATPQTLAPEVSFKEHTSQTVVVPAGGLPIARESEQVSVIKSEEGIASTIKVCVVVPPYEVSIFNPVVENKEEADYILGVWRNCDKECVAINPECVVGAGLDDAGNCYCEILGSSTKHPLYVRPSELVPKDGAQ